MTYYRWCVSLGRGVPHMHNWPMYIFSWGCLSPSTYYHWWSVSGIAAHTSSLLCPPQCSLRTWCTGMISLVQWQLYPFLTPIVALWSYNGGCLLFVYSVLVNFHVFFVNQFYLVMIPLHPALLWMTRWITLCNSSWTAILSHFLKKSKSIPRYLCFPHIDTVSSPKRSVIASIILVLAYLSMCDTLLPSTYQAIVHCLPYMVMFAMHLSYGLNTNPRNFRVFAYRSYQNSADSMQPYKYFNSLRYSTFTEFPIHTFFLCCGFISNMISTNPPSNLKWRIFLLAYQH